MDEKHIARFWSRVDKNGLVVRADLGACWVWTGAKNVSGHGVGWDGKRTRIAHRMAWRIIAGRWPGDCLCHKCDNPPCVNPDHMFEGSRADNLADMRAKGRQAPMPRRDMRGEKHARVKLTEAQVLEILDRAYAGERQKDLATEYGVTISNVGAIVTGRSWKHLPRPDGERPTKVKLTDELVHQIRNTPASGLALAKMFGVCPATISAIRRRQIWKHVA